MKPGPIIAALVAIVAIAFGVYMIDIDQTEEAALPDVDVEVEGGNLPKFDADVGEVSIEGEETAVTVPDVDVEVGTEEVELTLPDVDITPPEGDAEADEELAQN